MQGIFCYVGGTDVDDLGRPLEDEAAEDDGLASPRGSWGFSLPFFDINSGISAGKEEGLAGCVLKPPTPPLSLPIPQATKTMIGVRRRKTRLRHRPS